MAHPVLWECAEALVNSSSHYWRRTFMEGPARGCLAGLISWKLGGGLFSTILIFIIVYWLLGHVHC